MTNISNKATAVLEALRSHYESTTVRHDGEWGTVYLDNASVEGVSRHAFAGYLSDLTQKGLYLPIDKYFGEVKL